MPSVASILDKIDLAKDNRKPLPYVRLPRRKRVFYVMGIEKTEEVDRALADSLVLQLGTKNVDALTSQWLACGILTPQDAHPEAPHKISYQRVDETWGSHCVVALDGQMGTGTCWYACRYGHCTHQYAAEDLEGVRQHRKVNVAPAKQASVFLESAVSEERASSCEPPAKRLQRSHSTEEREISCEPPAKSARKSHSAEERGSSCEPAAERAQKSHSTEERESSCEPPAKRARKSHSTEERGSVALAGVGAARRIIDSRRSPSTPRPTGGAPICCAAGW